MECHNYGEGWESEGGTRAQWKLDERKVNGLYRSLSIVRIKGLRIWPDLWTRSMLTEFKRVGARVYLGLRGTR
jgi:hypothetical protein